MSKMKKLVADDLDMSDYNSVDEIHRQLAKEIGGIREDMPPLELDVFDNSIDWWDKNTYSADYKMLKELGFGKDMSMHLVRSSRLIDAYTVLQRMTVGYREQPIVNAKLRDRVEFLKRSTLLMCANDIINCDNDIGKSKFEELYDWADKLEMDTPIDRVDLSCYNDEQNAILSSFVGGCTDIIDALQNKKGYNITNVMQEFDIRKYIADGLNSGSEV